MTCSGCGKEKIPWAFATFRTRKGESRRRGICKVCRGKYAKKKFKHLQAWRKAYNKRNRDKRHVKNAERRAEIKAFVDRIKAATPCTDCRRRFPPVCMDFDHVKEKVRSVAGLVAGAYRIALVQEEIARCEVVCANCHRLRTQKRKQNQAPVIHVGRLPGSKNPIAKLNEKRVASSRVDYETGESVAALARRHGVTHATMWNVVNRRTWKHVA
jgi:hypothetical protein